FAMVSSALAWSTAPAWSSAGMIMASISHVLVPGMCALAPVVVWWWSSAAAFLSPERRWPAPRIAAGLILLVLVPLWLTVPGVSLGLCWLILGFALGRVALLGLGGTVMLAHLAVYYYQTHMTLLEKSASLCVAGGLLLGMAV